MKDKLLIEKFIRSCSHELRAPIVSIQGLVKIAEHYPNHEETQKCLGMIQASTSKMDDLIHSLQEYMTINHHGFKTESVNGFDLVDQIVSLHQRELTENSITVTREITYGAPWYIDRYGIFQVFRHLFSNAVAFHDPAKADKKIQIKVNIRKRWSSVEVTDNGIGIPKDHQPWIFDIFYKATTISQGLGTGLFLAGHMVEKMGAKIFFTSTENVGTNFRVNIPNGLTR